MLFKMLHRPVYRLIKPSLLAKEGVRSIAYNGKAGFIVQAFHFMPKSFGMRAGIVCFPRDEPKSVDPTDPDVQSEMRDGTL